MYGDDSYPSHLQSVDLGDITAVEGRRKVGCITIVSSVVMLIHVHISLCIHVCMYVAPPTVGGAWPMAVMLQYRSDTGYNTLFLTVHMPRYALVPKRMQNKA